MDTPSNCIDTQNTSRSNGVSIVVPTARQIRITNKFIGQLKSIPRLNHTVHLNTARRLYSFRDCAKQLGCTEVACRQSDQKTAIPYPASLLLKRINLLAMEPHDADCRAKKFFRNFFREFVFLSVESLQRQECAFDEVVCVSFTTTTHHRALTELFVDLNTPTTRRTNLRSVLRWSVASMQRAHQQPHPSNRLRTNRRAS